MLQTFTTPHECRSENAVILWLLQRKSQKFKFHSCLKKLFTTIVPPIMLSPQIPGPQPTKPGKKKSRDSPLSPELFIPVTFKPSPKELAEMDLLWDPTMQAVGFTDGTGNSFLTRT